MKKTPGRAHARTRLKKKSSAPKRNGSAFNKSRYVCGIFKGGDSNASTNKAYLSQYAGKLG